MEKLSDMDWQAIRREREETGATHRQLAEKHGVSRHAVEKRSVREGWKVKRKAIEETARQMIPDATTLQRKREEVAEKVAVRLADELSGFLSETVRQARAMMTQGQNLALHADNARDFRDAAAGWAVVHEGGRKAFGLDRDRSPLDLDQVLTVSAAGPIVLPLPAGPAGQVEPPPASTPQ